LHADKWVTPFSLLPLAVYASRLRMRISYGRNKSEVKGYLRNIRFPKGVNRIDSLSSTYLPLSRLSVESGDEYLTRYEDRIIGKVMDEKVRMSFQNSLKYLTSETVTNIKEHAQVDDYWLLAQYWPASETCEIAIADSGVGYLGSYRGTAYEVDTHEEAIKNVIHGCSSKDDVERGTGIPGMIKIFCEGYKGCVVIMTGDRLLYIEEENSDFYELDFNWDGVFVGIRFKLGIVNALAYLASS
jgi:hypothetical protein